jgi:hypothetical protein
MDTSTRLLTITAELVMMPAEIEDKKCRAVFDLISDSHNMGSFVSMPDGGVQMLSKKQKPNFIRYIIMKDRLVLSYEFCENSMNYYQGMMADYIAAFTQATGIGLFLMQGITIRKLVNMKGVDDSRDFLIKKVFSMKEENLQKFGRPLHMLGTRILFPGTQEDQSTYEVKIETLLEDYKTLFIENKAMFPQLLDTKKGADLGPVIKKTDDFINNNLMGFISQFA